MKKWQIPMIVLVALVPLLVSVILLQVSVGGNFTQLVPFWSDEVYFWHQAISFKEVGFDNGYYTHNEIPAEAPFARYYAWGLANATFMGMLAGLTDWQLNSMPMLSLAILCLACFVFLWVARLSWQQLLLFAIMIGTFIPIYLYTYTSLFSTFDFAFAIIIAGLVGLVWHQPQSRTYQISLIVFAILFALIRPFWGLFLPLFMMFIVERKTWRNLLMALVIGGVLFLGVYRLTTWLSSPFTNAQSIYNLIRVEGLNFELIFNNILQNIQLLAQGNETEVQFRLQLVILFVLIVIAVFTYRFQKKSFSPLLLLTSSLLLVIFLACVLIYDVRDWRDYRLLAPAMLVVLSLLVMNKQYWIVLGMIVFQLWAAPNALKVYNLWAGWHLGTERIEVFYAWGAEMQKVMVYEVDAPSAWCNTLNHSIYYLFNQPTLLMAVDPGIGLSSPIELEPNLPFKAQWLMLDNDFFTKYADQLNVEALLDLPNGKLYRNLDAEC
jgi:hypothetical protein